MAPFPYSGGKTRIAGRVWQELGADVYSYLEPFCGSAAVLLARPDAPGPRREIVGDLNGFVANAYRAIQADPDATARYAWWPSIHADLTARHRWLVRWGREGGLQRLMDDPGYYDAKVAGWWIWGISNWISISDFCEAAFATAGAGAAANWLPQIGCHPRRRGRGVVAQRGEVAAVDWLPHFHADASGHGVMAQRGGVGAPRDTRPGVKNVATGQGVSAARTSTGISVNGASGPDRWIPWFRALAARLERVYILARPWQTVLGSRTLLGDFEGHPIGIFLDPPYRTTGRQANLYAQDDGDAVFDAAWQWAKDHGDRPHFRIAICGLAGDFGELPERVGGSTAGATVGALGGAAARASRTRWCCSAPTAWGRPAPRLRKGNWGCKAMTAPPTRCPRCQGRLELQRPDPSLEVLRCLMCGRDAAWRPVAVYRPAAESDKNPVEIGTPPTAGAIRMAQRRSLFRMRGMCQVCGKAPVDGQFACPDCAARRKEVSLAFRQRRKDAGRCVTCNRAVGRVPGPTRCADCKRADRRRLAAKRAAAGLRGECYDCGVRCREPPQRPFQCAECQAKRRRRRASRRNEKEVTDHE